MNRIEIPLSKTKILLVLIGSIVFVVLGVLFLVSPDPFISPNFRSPQVVRIVGVAAIIFFGSVGVYGLRKLFDKEIGLIIDDTGITDNTNAASAGHIAWADITEIVTEQVMSTRFLLIFTANSSKYLDRASGFKRKLMQGNMNMYGTPLAITSNTVKYDFDALEKLLKDRLMAQQESIPNF